jgi:pilus assembly protein CpaC
MDGDETMKPTCERTNRRRAWGRKPEPNVHCPAWRWIALLFAAAAMVALLGLAVPGAVGTAQAQRLLQIGAQKRTASVAIAVGKSEDVRTDMPFIDIAVGDAEIADVNPLTDRALSILGKKIGTTRVTIYGEGKKLIGVFDVEVGYETAQLTEEIRRRFPHARIKVSSVNGRLMLTGDAPDALVLDHIIAIARQFGPDVINSVQVASPQQVMLEVRFVEAARSAGRELGVQWNSYSNNGRFLANIGDGTPAGALPINAGTTVAAGVLGTATPPFGFLVGKLLAEGMRIDVALNALEERGLARRLAEPNLVALSGDTANFLAGGEYPIPVPGQYGQIAIDYKRYGVSLAFTPTVLSGGVINLKIEPEVSQIDPSHSVTVGTSITVPALTVRRANTTIELRDGQSFVLAGLLQNESTTAQQQLPWIGDVPVLGTLFSSKSYQKSETDLVIIVTPRLVRPTRPGDPVRTTLDNTLPANDIDFFVLGKSEMDRDPAVRGETAALRPFTGHMLDLPRGGSHAALR